MPEEYIPESNTSEETDAASQGGSSEENAGAGRLGGFLHSRWTAWIAAGVLLLVVCVLGIVIWIRAQEIAEQRRRERSAAGEPVAVAVREIQLRTVTDRLQLPGIAQAWEEVWVTARSEGQVVEVLVEEGRDVKEGDLLCRIDDRDYQIALQNARGSVERARAARTLAEAELERARQLYIDGAVTNARLETAQARSQEAAAALQQAQAAVEKAALDLERTDVRAPISGTVSVLPVGVGDVLGKVNRVARIVDLSRVKVTVGIPERDVLVVKDLEHALMTFDALPGRSFEGRKVQLSIEPGQRVQVYRLELEVPNKDRLLRPGMFAKVDIIREVRPDSVVVPFFAVVGQGKDLFCFVVEEGVARRREVELGIFVGAEVEIISGLSAGDKVIIVGQRQLTAGDPVVISGDLPIGLSDVLP